MTFAGSSLADERVSLQNSEPLGGSAGGKVCELYVSRDFFVGLLGVAFPAHGQDWDSDIRAAMSDAGIPGMAVLVVLGGEVLMSDGFGVLRAGGDDPVTPETLFQVGSLTKAVTATAVAKLVGEGQVAWDEPIVNYLEGFGLADPWVAERLTVRDALAMRSGIVRGDTIALFSQHTRSEIARAARGLVPTRFRETYGLSPNLMYYLGGEMVAAVSGQSWDDYVAHEFFEPLGMSRTMTRFSQAETVSNYAWPHRRRDGKTEPLTERANADNVAAAAGVITNIEDWAKWTEFSLGDGSGRGEFLVGAEALGETRRPQILLTPAYQGYFNPAALLNAYGLGWVVSEYGGLTLIEHGGTLPGNASIIALMPEEGIGIVMMSNLALGAAIPTLLRLKFMVLDDLLDSTDRR